ncbi:hypothetical protein Y032_0009g675 [Ancylostoma ceylanicum]|uniref:Uncharacterized protein n=1 Tax=Ancylostoma ceylanicum TaxID=53326 RepID=A0A016VIB6_9BILA|nr:hypothetical protein Y032_0009g675 [Ancylostoma ceylanicum]
MLTFTFNLFTFRMLPHLSPAPSVVNNLRYYLRYCISPRAGFPARRHSVVAFRSTRPVCSERCRRRGGGGAGGRGWGGAGAYLEPRPPYIDSASSSASLQQQISGATNTWSIFP